MILIPPHLSKRKEGAKMFSKTSSAQSTGIFLLLIICLCAIVSTACVLQAPLSSRKMPKPYPAQPMSILKTTAHHSVLPEIYLTPTELVLPGFQPGGAIAVHGFYYLYNDQNNFVYHALRADPTISKKIYDPRSTFNPNSNKTEHLLSRFEQTNYHTYMRVYGGRNREDVFFSLNDKGQFSRYDTMFIIDLDPHIQLGAFYALPPTSALYLSVDGAPFNGLYLDYEDNGIRDSICHHFYYFQDQLYLLAFDQNLEQSKIYKADVQTGHLTLVMTHPADSFCVTDDQQLYYRDQDKLYQTTLADPNYHTLITADLPSDWIDAENARIGANAPLTVPAILPYTVNGNDLYYLDHTYHLYRNCEKKPLFNQAPVRSLQTKEDYTIILFEQSSRNPISLAVFDQDGRLIFQETTRVERWQYSRDILFYEANDKLYILSLKEDHSAETGVSRY